jgi:hypothetical protein
MVNWLRDKKLTINHQPLTIINIMTTKEFWKSASNWGFIGGAALFVANLIGWGLKLEAGNSWLYELLIFLVLCPLIIVTGRRNAAAAGAAGYSYGRAVGYVFAVMLFAGIVYGVGRTLMTNFIAESYYTELFSGQIDKGLAVYQSTPMYDSMRDTMLGMNRNPFWLIFSGVFEMVFKGGFLGLVVCAFVTRRPDIFAGAGAAASAPASAGAAPADENHNEKRDEQA